MNASPSRLLLVAGFALGTPALVSAQDVTLRGEVADDGPAFILACTPLVLTDGGVDLASFEGKDVQAVGHVVGPNTVEVTSAELVEDVFQVSSSAQVGGTLELEVAGPAGRVELFFVALDSGFATVKKMGFFLDPAAFTFVLQGVIPASGKLEVTLGIPDSPEYVFLDVFFQDVRLLAPGNFELGNVACVTIQP